jgi:hypothetical protein
MLAYESNTIPNRCSAAAIGSIFNCRFNSSFLDKSSTYANRICSGNNPRSVGSLHNELTAIWSKKKRSSLLLCPDQFLPARAFSERFRYPVLH